MMALQQCRAIYAVAADRGENPTKGKGKGMETRPVGHRVNDRI